MKISTLPLILIGASLLASCASQPELSRDEQLKVIEAKRQYMEKNMTRVYHGKSKQQILDAAQKVLTLSDGDDVTFSHGVNGFTAERKWHWYALISSSGVDRWTVEATTESTGGIKVVLRETTVLKVVNQPATYVYGMGVMNTGQATTSYIPTENNKPAIYDLFWRRMDYMLGLTKTWATCEAFEAEMKTNPKLEGNIKPLCGALAKDQLPEELRASK